MRGKGRAGARSRWRVALLAGTIALAGHACRRPSVDEPSLPRLVERLSEPGGYFDTDNLVSNETSYVQAVERLRPAGGVYIGVGPEQNFHYIARVRPRWAFIVDIRRDNLLEHLLFQAIFAYAATPYEYLCWLFGRPVVEGGGPASPEVDELVAAVERSPPRRETRDEHFAAILRRIGELGFTLSAEDRSRLAEMYRAFFRGQLELRFRSHGRPPMPYHPSYRTLLTARTPSGRPAHFLASPEGYAFVRGLVLAGRIVPVVGDFAGPKALRAVGAFVRERGETVSVFYVSNVEYYLIREGKLDAYVDNVRRLPLDASSLIVRAYFDYGYRHPAGLPGHRSTTVLQPALRFVRLYDEGVYRSYWDVCTVDYLP